MFNPRKWLELPPVFSRHTTEMADVTVLRDDALEGGSKLRFLPFLVTGAEEIVFGGPFCGGAPLALSVLGRESGQRVTLFYAKRKLLHRRQMAAYKNGANIIQVSPGYMTNVQAKARAYAQKTGALFLPLGFDVAAAEEPFVAFMESVRARIGSPGQIWCTVGSGMLARCLSKAFPESEINGVAVGLKSRHNAQLFGSNVVLHESRYDFAQETKATSPFPSCPNYDRKAWEICAVKAKGKVLMWNVLA